ncbi:MAG TPA: S8/S53 family peptidase [Ignavibacteria bacterium]|nr:S8/S53 family peptidase [Ignavibacteria bacterium]HMQ97965.1 S8/S53 family peptidase [Ignavibacteria bacterium]
MKKFLLFILCPLCLVIFSFRDNPELKYKRINERTIVRSVDGAKYQPGIINIKFKEHNNNVSLRSTGNTKVDNILNQYEVTKIFKPFPLKADLSKRLPGDDDLDKFVTIKYQGKIDPTDLSNEIFEANKDVLEWAEPEFIYDALFVPNDPIVSQQYHINRINCYQAWDITQGDTNVIIGIVDSGSDLDHPDLGANIKYNYADPIDGIDNDNNGYIDDFKGWDFYYYDNDPNIMGGSDHGSHVSGCASQVANNNVHGAGPGFKCKLRISKHAPDVPDNSIYNSNAGIVFLYQNGAKIINCSFGSASYSAATQNIINDAWAAGVVICASAGNDGINAPRYPASYDNVVNVAASNSGDIKASFSNYHTTVDVIAPGESILSTVYDNGYAVFNGTSMSTPITCGVVGLIKSKYPSWTNTQIVERLKLGVDSIYNLNPAYIGLLGTGRVNAFKCVTDNPIVSLISNTASDSLYGNNDKIYDVNEVVTFTLQYKNIWLTGSNVSLRLTTADPDVEIVQDSVYVGTLNAYTTYNTTPSNTFRVKAKTTCAFDKVVSFNLRTSSNAHHNALTSSFNVTFRQGWATHTVNNLKLSLTKDGAIGKKTQAYGSGLIIPTYNGNQLLESGLMIGINNTKVSDNCRRGSTPSNVSDTDFTAINSYTLQAPGTVSNEDGKGYFNDNGAGSNKIGVTVRAESFAWSGSADANYIILKYTIKNTSGANISNMYSAVYAYFTPNGVNNSNVAALDTVNKIGYSFNNTTTNPYLGVSLLSGQNLNFKAINATEVLNGFTTQEKWDAMSNGIVNGNIGPGINCFVISGGPVNLNNNDSVVVGFAVVKGNDLNELRINNTAAKNRFNVIGIEPISNILPERFALYQNYPNPFNPSTTIKFDLPKNDFVNIKVFDIIGREVSSFSSELDAGSYKYEFNAANLSSGVYFYKFESNFYSDVKRMILIK